MNNTAPPSEQHTTSLQLLEPLTGPLAEAQLIPLTNLIQEISANRNLLAFLELTWGDMERIDTVALSSVEKMGSEETSGVTVWDESGKLLLPDLSLPFWQTAWGQERDTAAVLLEQDLDWCADDDARMVVLNAYLYAQEVFKEMGLPRPVDESPFYQRRVRLSSVPMTYPRLYHDTGYGGYPHVCQPEYEHDGRWPVGLEAGVRIRQGYAADLKEIYNRWAEFPAYIIYRVARYLAETKEAKMMLPPEGHICYLWKTLKNGGRNRRERCLIQLEFKDERLLLRLFVPGETIPLERITLFVKEVDVPVHRVDTPLPDHPAAAWFMDVVRALETPPLLAMTAQVSQEIASEWIWGVCQELADARQRIAQARGDAFPRPFAELETEHARLAKRLQKMTASTGITRLNLQAEIVCLAAQMLLQRYTPEDELIFPWSILLNALGECNHAVPILAARAKVAFLVTHPELAHLPYESGLSLRGPLHAVGMAIREAIRKGVYQ